MLTACQVVLIHLRRIDDTSSDYPDSLSSQLISIPIHQYRIAYSHVHLSYTLKYDDARLVQP